MTAARLSPAASLLRNSKLFALPPAVALPNLEPSSEPIPRSDTATSIYPTRAAIETPLASLNRGDWGFKRPLPLKSTTKSGTPVVRLNKGIDTIEHIADFDSAADHVLTLKKFQEISQSIEHPTAAENYSRVHLGVFRRDYDNTTNVLPIARGTTHYTGVWPNVDPATLHDQLPAKVQKDANDDVRAQLDRPASTPTQTFRAAYERPRRWRYAGPSLVQMSGHEFDQYLKTLDESKRSSFRAKAKEVLIAEKREKANVAAREAGTMEEVQNKEYTATEEEVSDFLRLLRQQPRKFGPLIAQFLDLPEGPSAVALIGTGSLSERWEYGRDTLASEFYEDAGPPRTHPSAGLSYIHNTKFAQNHAMFGPQLERRPVAARTVKVRAKGIQNVANLGVAGFIVKAPSSKSLKDRAGDIPAFEPIKGGQKMVVKPGRAQITEQGALQWSVNHSPGYILERELPVHVNMRTEPDQIDNAMSNTRQAVARRNSGPTQYRKRETGSTATVDDEVDNLFGEMVNRLGEQPQR